MKEKHTASKSASSPAVLRRRAEEIAREKAAPSPENIVALSPEETRKTLHELQVHQIELEMQNEELRRVQAELDAARARYFDLYNLAPVGYCTISEKGLILETNLTAAILLGTAQGALVKQPVSRFILKDDQDVYYLHHKQIFETRSADAIGSPPASSLLRQGFGGQAGQAVAPHTCELRMVKQDGTIFWAQLESSAAQDAAGAPVARVMLSDITERKQAEEALNAKEERFRELFNRMSSGAALYEAIDNGGDFIFRDFNPAAEMMDKVGKKDILGKRVSEVFPGVKAFGIFEVFQRVWQTGKPEHFPGSIYKDAVTPESWRENWVFKLPTGEIVAIYNDITENKQAEETLQKERQRLDGIIKGTNSGTWEWNVQTGETIFNNRWAEIIGYKLEELSPVSIKTWMKYAHPDDLKASNELLEKHFHGKLDYYEFESRMKHKNGNWVWVLDRGKVTSWTEDGKPLMMMGTHQDITERKRIEEALRESESQKNAILNSITTNIALVDKELKIIWANKASANSVDKRTEDMVGHPCYSFWGDPAKPCANCPTLKALQTKRSEHAIVQTPDGKSWEEGGEPIFDKEGNVIAVIEIARDITERQREEDEKVKQLDELRRWRSITLGREGRIGDLKREVNALAARLGEKPRYASVEANNHAESDLP